MAYIAIVKTHQTGHTILSSYSELTRDLTAEKEYYLGAHGSWVTFGPGRTLNPGLAKYDPTHKPWLPELFTDPQTALQRAQEWIDWIADAVYGARFTPAAEEMAVPHAN